MQKLAVCDVQNSELNIKESCMKLKRPDRFNFGDMSSKKKNFFFAFEVNLGHTGPFKVIFPVYNFHKKKTRQRKQESYKSVTFLHIRHSAYKRLAFTACTLIH